MSGTYSDIPECTCSEADLASTGGAFHVSGCLVRERLFAEAAEREAVEQAERERKAAERRKQVEAAPKSRRTGRITGTESSRREALGMGETARNDPRLTPCMLFCYLQMAARWWEAGSVFVVATPGWLADRSDDRFTLKQCRRAIAKLRLLGYLDPASWSKVKKHDPGLYGYVKQKRAGTPGTWPAVYHMRQDIPERESIPDDENPLLEMAAAV